MFFIILISLILQMKCGFLASSYTVSPQTVNSIATYSFKLFTDNFPIGGSIQVIFAPQIKTILGNVNCVVVWFFTYLVMQKLCSTRI